MREAKLIKTAEIAISDIDATERLRPVNLASVEALVASIETLGRMKDEIHVRQIAHQDNRLVLIAGGHRLAAAKRLGWEKISAKIWDCADDWAKLLEIDDNLAGSELSALELSVFLVERKRIYEKLYPETKQGGDRGNQHTGGRQNDVVSFCQSTAEKRSMSKRQIERYIKAGETLTKDEITRLFGHCSILTQADLLALAGLSEQKDRAKAIDAYCEATFQPKEKRISIKTAVAHVKAKSAPTTPSKSQDERDLEALNKLFKRASKAVQDRFIEDNQLARAAEVNAARLKVEAV